MGSALSAGVSGLVAHDRMLDVVGNNLANLNTTAYKSRRILFSDLIYSTSRSASSSVTGSIGGTNPSEIGSGTKVSQVDINIDQGNLDPTGGAFDFAIEGEGFFVLTDGRAQVYSRAGAFALDDTGTLVDPSTGYRVQRFGRLGESNGANPGFQVAGNADIKIPFGTTIPGESTNKIDISGNLPVDATGPAAQVLTTSSPFLTTSGAAATTSTALNDLESNVSNYVAGDVIDISGTNSAGANVTSTFTLTTGSETLGDLVNAIGGAYSDATASVDSNGNLVVQADASGDSFLNLSIADASGNTGGTDFGDHLFAATTVGKEGDTFDSTVEVFDLRGGAHSLNVSFQKLSNNEWKLTAAIDPSEGTVLDGSIDPITFNDDGSLQQAGGTGLGDVNITFQINGISSSQTVQFAFGDANSFEGLTQLAAPGTVTTEQDGFAPGTLTAINVGSDGVIQGVATNGKRFPVAQLALASFRNAKGLISVGDNYFEQSLNTGEAQIGSALSGGRGAISGGQLESSNVDVAQEFTRLIIAQRGFSANARTITVTDEVLEELTNLVR